MILAIFFFDLKFKKAYFTKMMWTCFYLLFKSCPDYLPEKITLVRDPVGTTNMVVRTMPVYI